VAFALDVRPGLDLGLINATQCESGSGGYSFDVGAGGFAAAHNLKMPTVLPRQPRWLARPWWADIRGPTEEGRGRRHDIGEGDLPAPCARMGGPTAR
jgi:hypothetical protein